jgi:hypothetical protein
MGDIRMIDDMYQEIFKEVLTWPGTLDLDFINARGEIRTELPCRDESATRPLTDLRTLRLSDRVNYD